MNHPASRPPAKQPRPDNARLVFSGVLFDIYQWEQKLFDGTTTTFETIRRRHDSANIIAVTSDGKIILGKEEQPGMAPFVGLPAGRIEVGEDPLVAAGRELLEETGYQTQNWQLWDAVQPATRMDWACFTFLAKGCQKVRDQSPDAGEKIEPMLVSFDEFMDLIAEPSFRDTEVALELLRRKNHSTKLAELRRQLLVP